MAIGSLQLQNPVSGPMPGLTFQNYIRPQSPMSPATPSPARSLQGTTTPQFPQRPTMPFPGRFTSYGGAPGAFGPPASTAAPRQIAMPGAGATGSQIDRPGGLGGYSPAAPQDPRDAFFKLYQNDEILNAQRDLLNAQLRGDWTGSIIPQAQQALIALGLPAGTDLGRLQQSLSGVGPVDLSGNPLLIDPNTRQVTSFAQSLLNPDVSGAAQSNPYSALAQIQNQQAIADARAHSEAAASGLEFSGGIAQDTAQNAYDYGAQRYQKVSDFLGGLNNLFSGYQDKLSQAQGTLGSYDQATQARITDLINSGWLTGQPGQSNATPVSVPRLSGRFTLPSLANPVMRPGPGQRRKNMPGRGPRALL